MTEVESRLKEVDPEVPRELPVSVEGTHSEVSVFVLAAKPQWVGRRGTVLDAVHYMNFAFAGIPRKFLGRQGFGDIENCHQDAKLKESIATHCIGE